MTEKKSELPEFASEGQSREMYGVFIYAGEVWELSRDGVPIRKVPASHGVSIVSEFRSGASILVARDVPTRQEVDEARRASAERERRQLVRNLESEKASALAELASQNERIAADEDRLKSEIARIEGRINEARN